MRIMALDVAALALGLAPGMMLADARALVPDLAALPHDPNADAALLDWLADGCARYTPMVEIDPPLGLLLDITGCTHFYSAGEAGMIADLSARLARLGLSARMACADTPDGARALAAFGGGDVKALPVTALRVPAATHIALQRAGLYTLGDLATRPRAPLAARFGANFPTLLARTLGEEDAHITPRRPPPAHITPRRPPPALSTEMRFAEPVAQADVNSVCFAAMAMWRGCMLKRECRRVIRPCLIGCSASGSTA